jgi:biopolymer transport protein ExbD
MKLRRRDRFRAEVATASLNDIMFFLLLFFLIISTVANPNVVKVLLPKSDASQSLSKKQISITITADKSYFIDKQKVAPELLEGTLKELIKDIDEPTAVLRMDQQLNVQDLVDIISVGNRLNMRIVLATDKP